MPQGSRGGLAPRLDRVSQRLRPEFLERWIANPKRLLPYTGMPVNFPIDKPADQKLFKGHSDDQVEAVVDLLLNWPTEMEGAHFDQEDGQTGHRAGGHGRGRKVNVPHSSTRGEHAMVRRAAFRYIVASLVLILPLAVGCGKSDKGPPPGATVEVGPPNITIGSPTDSQAGSTKPADGSGAQPAEHGDK